ncbi:MAG TPA: acyltransferase family protein [Streptosporangiaceae bacterium]|nr:acyltransferase family protein [Streptosporangiaceae bacterium]
MATRDKYIDTLRAAALVRVVTYHSFSLPWLPFVFPSMGIMFALAGSLVLGSLDRTPAKMMLRRRLHRLLPPVWVFGLVAVTLMLWHGWTVSDDGPAPLTWRTILFWVFPISDPPGSVWGFDMVEPLWYIRAYLWFLLASPMLRWAWRRYGMATLVVPLAVLVATQMDWLSVGQGRVGEVITDAAVFGACWLLGFAHYDGRLRKISLRWLLPVVVVAAAVGMTWALHHQEPAPDLWDINNIPLADGFWSFAAVLLLLRFYPSFNWLDRHAVLDRLIVVINARAMTIYLWNNVAIFGAYTITGWFDWAGGWREVVLIVALTWAGVGLAVLVVGPIEDLAARRRPTLWPGRRADQPRRQRHVDELDALA